MYDPLSAQRGRDESSASSRRTQPHVLLSLSAVMSVDWVWTGCGLSVDWVSTGCGLSVDWVWTECGLSVDWV